MVNPQVRRQLDHEHAWGPPDAQHGFLLVRAVHLWRDKVHVGLSTCHAISGRGVSQLLSPGGRGSRGRGWSWRPSRGGRPGPHKRINVLLLAKINQLISFGPTKIDTRSVHKSNIKLFV